MMTRPAAGMARTAAAARERNLRMVESGGWVVEVACVDIG